MSKVAIKRILQKDVQSIEHQQLNDMGIYIEFNEANMLEAVAMIIGPKDSVYKNGILFFLIKFPHNYPYSPPLISYISRGSIRIHPNLYTGISRDNYFGKVCLSILGTWSGPQWTTIMDISSVFISILSLLDKNPLDHEPGFYNKRDEHGELTKVHKNYSKCVLYETYKTLILKNIFDIPDEFNCFKDIITSHYNENKGEIISDLNTIIDTNNINEEVYVSIYRIRIKLDYLNLKNNLCLL
jgi:ubiquitin-protein ligase